MSAINPVEQFLRSDRIPHIWCPGCGIGTTVNCFAAVRGRALRISPHLHTTDEDVERLIEGLTLAIHPHGS